MARNAVTPATDQRFWGDERFVEKVASRAKVKDIEAKGPKVEYERLLDAVSREYGLTRAALTGSGRQRPWIEGRRFLVYLAREWGKMTTEDLGKRLERDPSMISRLYRDYAGNRELERERRMAVALTHRIQTQPDPSSCSHCGTWIRAPVAGSRSVV